MATVYVVCWVPGCWLPAVSDRRLFNSQSGSFSPTVSSTALVQASFTWRRRWSLEITSARIINTTFSPPASCSVDILSVRVFFFMCNTFVITNNACDELDNHNSPTTLFVPRHSFLRFYPPRLAPSPSPPPPPPRGYNRLRVLFLFFECVKCVSVRGSVLLST